MEDNLSKAKRILNEENATCVYCCADEVYISHEKGIKPTLVLIDENVDLNGFSVCDAVVGKAAAMLFKYVGAKQVHANLISEAAMKYLDDSGIEYTYTKQCKNIINRTKTGICPLEMATLDLTDENEALVKIRQTLKQLRENAMK